jgi:hypothetical protein
VDADEVQQVPKANVLHGPDGFVRAMILFFSDEIKIYHISPKSGRTTKPGAVKTRPTAREKASR